MIQNPSRPSEELLAAVTRDLRPVRPSPLPSRQAFRLIPLALLAALAVLAVMGIRRDAVVLGPLGAWGFWITQLAAGVGLIWIAVRESTPAHRLPQSVVSAALAAALLMVAGVALWTFAASPTVVPSRLSAWRIGLFCGVGGTLAGTLLVLLIARFLGRSLAARPALAGALAGASAGIIVNASWRLACPISSPAHSLTAHGAAVVATTLLGACLVSWMARRPGKS
jgi:hypothetical protein